MLIYCPKCSRVEVEWMPAPTQQDDEDTWGPCTVISDLLKEPARLSPPDSQGQTWLLVKRKPGIKPSYWPAELNCPLCRAEGEAAAKAWNDFLEKSS